MPRRLGPKPPKPGHSLADLHPCLASEWHPTKNGDLSPYDVIPGCILKVWWRQPDGHEWPAVIKSRTRLNAGCAVCNGKRVQTGVNDLASQRPFLAHQWHPTKNGDTTPSEVYQGETTKKRWWHAHGHEWEAPVYCRVRGDGCCICAGTQVQVGVNDLATIAPFIARQWHPTKNANSTPQDLTLKAARMLWWLDHGHEWKALVANRAIGNGCAVCHGKQVQVGVNDLATLRPDLVLQWHPTRNGDLDPRSITVSARYRVWWRCSKDHEWDTDLPSRSLLNSQCPDCAEESGNATSLAEQALRRELGSLYPGTHKKAIRVPRTYGRFKTWACDIGIDLSDGRTVIVEYDSQNYHAGLESSDQAKSDDLRQQGYLLVRVRLGSLQPLHTHDLRIPLALGHHRRAASLAQLVAKHLTRLGVPPDGATVIA